VNVSFLQELLNTVAEQGRQLLPRVLRSSDPADGVVELARALMSGRGEASGVALARQILDYYRVLEPDARRAFFRFLAEDLQPDPTQVAVAAEAYLQSKGESELARLQAAVDSPRHEFFRRLNLAPGATAEIVNMRRDLLRQPQSDAALGAVDTDLMKLLQSWFNRGFLVLRRIDWQTPAAILEKIIAYEAVHEIQGWDDLRRRLDPDDRRCFAFFHPALIDEPLIFVEVALMREPPQAISAVLQEERKAGAPVPDPVVAVFYSISNCQEGLKGISFGNFLIKQVVEELAKEKPSLKTFVTLSPIPHFARWLDRAEAAARTLPESEHDALVLLDDPGWQERPEEHQELKKALTKLAAHYFVNVKSPDGRPVDPVARFHLGNGARLERINWLGDASEKGLREAHGLMVNYRYEISEIERNHEAFANDGTVVVSRAVRALVKGVRAVPAEPEQALLPPPPSGNAQEPAAESDAA
jgi:malonyl-CoA decarboxylase